MENYQHGDKKKCQGQYFLLHTEPVCSSVEQSDTGTATTGFRLRPTRWVSACRSWYISRGIWFRCFLISSPPGHLSTFVNLWRPIMIFIAGELGCGCAVIKIYLRIISIPTFPDHWPALSLPRRPIAPTCPGDLSRRSSIERRRKPIGRSPKHKYAKMEVLTKVEVRNNEDGLVHRSYSDGGNPEPYYGRPPFSQSLFCYLVTDRNPRTAGCIYCRFEIGQAFYVINKFTDTL